MDSVNTSDEYETLSSFMDDIHDVQKFKPATFEPRERAALILCSSGTTGPPKGVLITHRNLTARFAQFMDPMVGMLNNPETNMLSVFPMCHIGGLGTFLTYLMLGFENIVMKKFSTNQFLRTIQDYEVESTFVPPPVMTILAKSPLVEKYNLSSLRELSCGAAPLSKEIVSDVLKRLPSIRYFRQAYGLTETTMAVTYTPRSDCKDGSSGTLLPYTSAKVTNILTREELGPNQLGELCFKGEIVMKGYVNNENATNIAISSDGWLYTGDIGYYDKDEHFYVVDRLKDLINYKGYQFSPCEIEAILLQHPKIKDAAVIGIDDDFAGQLAKAYVVKGENELLSEKEVEDFVAGQISFQKHLHGGVEFIDKVPRTTSGKISKISLRNLTSNVNISKNNAVMKAN